MLTFSVQSFLPISTFGAVRGALQNASWPPLAIYSDAKELIAKFFELVDLPDPNSGKKLAEEVFTEDDALAAGPDKSTGLVGTF